MTRSVAAGLFCAALAGCISLGEDKVAGSGPVVKQDRTASPFTRINVNGTTDLNVTIGSPPSIVVEAQKNVADLIKTSVSGDTLTVDEEKPYTTHDEAVVRVTIPRIESLRMRGSSSSVLANVSGGDLELTISGAGNIRASGNVGNLNLDCSGAGNADLTKLVARDAVVRLSGVGNANLNVTGTLDVAIYGVGSVTYRGRARVVRQEIRGVGSLSHE